MQLLADRQRHFAAAILDPSLAVPPHLVGPDGEPSPKRFAVYRNNVVVGLTEALRANFPVACRIVGEEFFQEMARAYISSYPPHSPILLDYGISFAGFIADFEPAASLPYLPDVARIERAWTEAYHAHEAEPIDAEVLASIPSDQTANICFAVHPSLRIVRSQFPALTIWRMNVDDGVPAPLDLDSAGEDALVLRPTANVEVRSMPFGGAEFLNALVSGMTLAAATNLAIHESAEFDLTTNIAALINAGVFVGYSITEQARESYKA